MNHKTKIYIGIDNGVSGSIGIVLPHEALFYKMPVKKQQDYHKSKSNITRIDTEKLAVILKNYCDDAASNDIIIGMENPMVNPQRWKASVSALRAFEATLVVVESMKVPYYHILSKDWQKEFFPKGFATGESKTLSLQKGRQFFPKVETKHPDYDGLLIAKYLQHQNL